LKILVDVNVYIDVLTKRAGWDVRLLSALQATCVRHAMHKETLMEAFVLWKYDEWLADYLDASALVKRYANELGSTWSTMGAS
jgi:hypothetical protein